MQIIQSRRDFLTAPVGTAPAASAPHGSLAGEGPLGDDHGPAGCSTPSMLSGPAVRRRGTAAARKASPMSVYVKKRGGATPSQRIASRRAGFRLHFSRRSLICDRSRRPDHRAGGHAPRVFRAIRQRTRPTASRDLKGQEVGDSAVRAQHVIRRHHGGLRRARPRRRISSGSQILRCHANASSSSTARSMPSSASRRSRRICAPARSAT